MNVFKKLHYIKSLNRCLAVSLTDWQINFIFGKSDFLPPNRAIGKTLSYMLRILLSAGDPIVISHLPPRGENEEITDYYATGLDNSNVKYFEYRKYYIAELRKLYNLLRVNTNIALRKLIFRNNSVNSCSERTM